MRQPMPSYYSTTLSAERLRSCYHLAPPSVQRYLASEIEFVRQRSDGVRRALELGCGYGRVLRELAGSVPMLLGIDTSVGSTSMARTYLADADGVTVVVMDAINLGFPEGWFDLVYCVQNGISAFHVDQRALVREAVRVTRRGGTVLFSSYAEEFWEDRLEWFRIQARHGLVGEIDETATGSGVIVTTDGFSATTVSAEQFRDLARGQGRSTRISIVAGSSVFCEIVV
jgi:2-polyprenyl-6-hydroxyphenyl methylase/3-demethylubiquinone-9 3-methyltransferase